MTNDFLKSIGLSILLATVGCLSAVAQNDTIPFYDANGGIILQIEVNGKKYPMLFDCGATLSASKELWEELKLTRSSSQSFGDSQGNTIKSQLGMFPEFTLGHQHYSGMTALMLDIANVPGMNCYDIKGVVGPEVMRGRCWTLDFQRQRIIIRDSVGDISDNAFWVPMTPRFNGQPWFEMNFGHNEKILTCFDSGSNSAITLDRNLAKCVENAVKPKYKFIECGFTGTGGGGYGKADTIVLLNHANGVFIGDYELKEQNIRLRSKPINLIGTKVMRQFVTTLDYPRKRIIFQPIDHDKVKPSATQGITFGWKDGHIIVASISGKDAAHLPDIKQGVVVLKINDNLMPSPAKPSDLCTVFSTKYNEKKKLKIQYLDEHGSVKTYIYKRKSN